MVGAAYHAGPGYGRRTPTGAGVTGVALVHVLEETLVAGVSVVEHAEGDGGEA